MTDALLSNRGLMLPFSISEFPPGTVRCVLGGQNFSDLGEIASRAPDGVRWVTCRCSTLEPLEATLDHYVATIAEAALLIWPHWYDGDIPLDSDADLSGRSLVDRLTTRQMLRAQRGINGAWFSAATHACRAGRSPFLQRFPLALQAEQLAMAIAEDELILAIEIDGQAASRSSLLNLSRGLEWLARETGARVAAFLPESMATRSELDGITFGALRLTVPAFPQTIDDAEERKHLVCPIIGRPHPASPGEQKLAARLARDDQLASLFRCNERVTTVFGSRFLVDLVWQDGRIAVEIDGYRHHSSPAAFCADRHRDYELTLTGYLVLRLPHDGVVADVDLAVERIREFVNFRTKHPFSSNEIPA